MRIPRLPVAVAALSVLVLVPATARSDTQHYVALGDSYSAGVGTGHRTDGCYHAPDAYPHQVAQAHGWALDLRACSGATLPEIERDQLGGLTSDTAVVTVSGGGNDAGFKQVLLECVRPGWLSRCRRALDRARDVIVEVVPARLDSLLHQIAARAPRARTVVVGYPHLFAGHDCQVLTWFSRRELRRMNDLTDLLDETTRAAAERHGFTFVDPRPGFAGHEICSGDPLLHGLTWPVDDSFHPTSAGNERYAALVTEGLTRTAEH